MGWLPGVSLLPYAFTVPAGGCASEGHFEYGAGGQGGYPPSNSAGTGGSTGGSAASLEAACTSYAGAYCQWFSCQPFVFESSYADEATCVEQNELACLYAFAAEGTNVQSADLEACVEEMRDEPCGSPFGWRCRFLGTKPDGASCFESARCQRGGATSFRTRRLRDHSAHLPVIR
jgi:hypothetical protein